MIPHTYMHACSMVIDIILQEIRTLHTAGAYFVGSINLLFGLQSVPLFSQTHHHCQSFPGGSFNARG